MRSKNNILLKQLQGQTKSWSHWVSAGFALSRVSTLPPVITATGNLIASGTLASWCLPALVGLGTHHSLSGATTASYTPALTGGTIHATQGQPFTLIATIKSAKEGTAVSYTIAGHVPNGITPQEGSITNGYYITFTGIPTQSGSFVISIRGWAKADGKGDNTPFYDFTLIVDAAVSSPEFAAQPGNSFANWGGTAQFTASVSNATSLRWRRNGVPLSDGSGISGSATSTLTLSQVTSEDHGDSFDLVATGASGTVVVSNAAILDVSSSAYELWREQNFLPPKRFDDTVSGTDADPDGDSRHNSLEFSLNSNPKVIDPADPFDRTIEMADGVYVLRLGFSVNPAMAESDLLVEQAIVDNLATWTSLSAGSIDRSISDRWVATVPLTAAPVFVRLRATP